MTGRRSKAVGNRRIHITGASGAGVTSLGRAIASALAASHHDTDDYFWLPTTPPFRGKRDPAERLRLMMDLFLPRAEWVLSGSLQGWGDPLISYFDMVVFLYTPKAVRLKRIRDRETARFGADAVAPGGWRHDETEQYSLEPQWGRLFSGPYWRPSKNHVPLKRPREPRPQRCGDPVGTRRRAAC